MATADEFAPLRLVERISCAQGERRRPRHVEGESALERAPTNTKAGYQLLSESRYEETNVGDH